MMRCLKTAIALACLSAPAVAQTCPDISDLETGIRFEIAGGDFEVFRTFGPDVVQSEFGDAQGAYTRVLLAQGLYVLELIDLDNGALVPSTRTTYAYSGRPSDLPVPDANGRVVLQALVNEAGSLESETQIYEFGPQTTLAFGTCSYAMIPVVIRYQPDDEGTEDHLHWLPELGLSYLSRSVYGDTDDRYDYLSIQALR